MPYAWRRPARGMGYAGARPQRPAPKGAPAWPAAAAILAATGVATLAAIVVALVALPGAHAATVDIRIQEVPASEGGLQFVPRSVTIQVGDTVRWIDEAPASHTVTSTDSNAPPGQQTPDGRFDHTFDGSVGDTFEHRFDEPGSFPYYCRPHADWMFGTITVQAAPSSDASSSGAPATDREVEGTTGGDEAQGSPGPGVLVWVAALALVASAAARRR